MTYDHIWKRFLSYASIETGFYMILDEKNNLVDYSLVNGENKTRKAITHSLLSGRDVLQTYTLNIKNYYVLDEDDEGEVDIISYKKNPRIVANAASQLWQAVGLNFSKSNLQFIKNKFGEEAYNRLMTVKPPAQNTGYNQDAQHAGRLPEDDIQNKNDVQNEKKKEEADNMGFDMMREAGKELSSEFGTDMTTDTDQEKLRQFVKQDRQNNSILVQELLDFRSKGQETDDEDKERLKALHDYTKDRYKLAILNSLKTDDNTKDQIIQNYFAQRPSADVGSKKISVVDFGRMNPKNKLRLLYSKSTNMDNMMKLMYSNTKMVFNKSLLTEKGAKRFAKANNGTLAPIQDYDGDGVKDFLIYDQNGKLIAINGFRLKKDDKHALKRLFYQFVPDPKMQKALGGFEGWINTQLFQVGPYNHLGQREVRVPKETMELLNYLKSKGYLSKKVESYIPRNKKTFAATVKGHLLDSIKWGLFKQFPDKTKVVNYLPLNLIRDFIYKVVIGSEMSNLAEANGQLNNIVGQVKNYAANKSKKPSVNELYKLLSQYISSDENAKNTLYSRLEEVIDTIVPYAHVIAAYYAFEQTSFAAYIAKAPTDAEFNAGGDKIKDENYLLTELRNKWKRDIRNATNERLSSLFGNISLKQYPVWVQKHVDNIQKVRYHFDAYGVKEGQAMVIKKPNTDYYEFKEPKYLSYNEKEGETFETPNYLFTEPLTRYDGQKNATNQNLIDARKYFNTVKKGMKQVWHDKDGKAYMVSEPVSDAETNRRLYNKAKELFDIDDISEFN